MAALAVFASGVVLALPATAAPLLPAATRPAATQPTGNGAAPIVNLRLTTPWTNTVDRANALPEYPRPQLVRAKWLGLNGTWEFAGGTPGQAAPLGQALAGRVNVPFGIEQPLSGVGRHYDRFFYRRSFTVPADWSGQRVKLNFGAVGQVAQVYVNGTQVGTHTGGYEAFAFDVTGSLRSGANEIVVAVDSTLDNGTLPLGKQTLNPSGIFYTASSGIWQTVWLEPTPTASVAGLKLIPDVPGNALTATVSGTAGQTATVTAYQPGTTTVVGSASGAVGSAIRVPVPNAHLWTPDDPYLYDLKVTLSGGDVVTSYFGMRSITLGTVNGVIRPLLNGKFVFQFGTLDQGFWPDGGYTAPTDTALRSDIDKLKSFGFNTVRKHIKVEPQRWYYWADKLGLMVWQDMPSMPLRLGQNPPTTARTEFERELHSMVDQHVSSPSIITWVDENEGWVEYDPARIADSVKAQDPSRLVDNMSGWSCCGYDGGNGDIADHHNYQNPTSPGATERMAAVGEYGGVGERVTNHVWDPNSQSPYGGVPDNDGAALLTRYSELADVLKGLITRQGLSAAIYTETSDVEGEVNGLVTYDRQVTKASVSGLNAVNTAVIGTGSQVQGGALLPTGTQVSLQVVTPGYTNRAVAVSGTNGVTTPVDKNSTAAVKRTATFVVRPGLASSSCVSLEVRGAPGQYLRHRSLVVGVSGNDGGTFAADATFCPVAPNDRGKGISLRAFNDSARYLRHYNSQLYIGANGGADPGDAAASWAADTSFAPERAWYRNQVDLPSGWQSLQVTTPGYTNRYARHFEGDVNTSVIDASTDATTKADATWRFVPGLDDPTCYSIESKNFPGEYLRHSAYRAIRTPIGSGVTEKQDATWCTVAGLGGTGVSFESDNLAGRFVRHIDSAVWNANGLGFHPYDAPGSFAADATWAVVAPWAP